MQATGRTLPPPLPQAAIEGASIPRDEEDPEFIDNPLREFSGDTPGPVEVRKVMAD